jgi:RNA polymerase sigma-70 factor (ECF subfamily)
MAAVMEIRRPELDEFCDRVRSKLVGALSLQVGRGGAAEELANDALMRVIERWPEVQAMDNPEGWTFTVAFNLARSRFRRLTAERRAHARLPRFEEHTAADDRDAAVAVRNALKTLPARQRQAVVCRYYLDMSIDGTAAVMGCAPNTVKVHLRGAMASLRERGLTATDDEEHNDG